MIRIKCAHSKFLLLFPRLLAEHESWILKQILCISLSPIERDARVLRQISMLSELGEVTTIGFGQRPAGSTHHYQVPDGLLTLPQTVGGVLKLALRNHQMAECSSPAARWVLQQGIINEWNLVVANDARVLDLAFQLKGSSPLWADMHEWAPEERTHIFSWRMLVAPFMRYLCDKYLHRADLVTTVSAGIADLYLSEFNVPARVFTSATNYREIKPTQVDEKRIACVHSGGAIAGRGLEQMIQVFQDLPEQFTLDMYLVPGGDDGAHFKDLVQLAGSHPRITFHQPVSPDKIPMVLSQYDVGVFWIPPTHTNARLTLPNKFFDFVQGRLAVAIGPSIEMVRELNLHGLGVVSDSFEHSDLKASLVALEPADIQKFKTAANKAAKELSFETQKQLILPEIEKLLA